MKNGVLYMNAYNFIYVWLFLFAIMSNFMNMTVQESVQGRNVRRWNIVAAVVVFLPIFLLASLGTPESDTPLYIEIFKGITQSWNELLKKLSSEPSGQGFIIFQFFVKKLFGNNVTAFRLVLAAIHSLPVILIFRKYSDNYWMSIFLFVASACHISWMMNGLRQFMAVVIIFAATPLLCRKNYIQMIVVIFLASTIHISAWIMLPVIFIVQGKAWNTRTIFAIVASLIAMYIFDRYTGTFDALLIGTEFEGAVNEWKVMGDDGTNPIRVLVNAIPMILSFLGQKYIRNEKSPILNICTNMSVITTGIYLVSMVTSGIMIGRLPIYTSLYNFILLPKLIPLMFTKNSSRIVTILMCGCYIVYYLIEVGF